MKRKQKAGLEKKIIDSDHIAWHYTTGEKFLAIVKHGFLMPATAHINVGERPVLWFSLQQHWEPTAQKASRAADGTITRLGMAGTYSRGGGLVRFGIPAEITTPWPALGKKAGIASRVMENLEHTGVLQGATPSLWCGVLAPVPVAACIVDVFDSEDGPWARVPTDSE